MNFNSYMKLHELSRKRHALTHRLQEHDRRETDGSIRALVLRMRRMGEPSDQTETGNVHPFKAPPNQ